jgi:hypothetical protein
VEVTELDSEHPIGSYDHLLYLAVKQDNHDLIRAMYGQIMTLTIVLSLIALHTHFRQSAKLVPKHVNVLAEVLIRRVGMTPFVD